MTCSLTRSMAGILVVALFAVLAASEANAARGRGRVAGKARQFSAAKRSQISKAQAKNYVRNKVTTAAKRRTQQVLQTRGKDLAKRKAQSLGLTKAQAQANKAQLKNFVADKVKDRAKDRAKQIAQNKGKEMVKNRLKQYGIDKAKQLAHRKRHARAHRHHHRHHKFGLFVRLNGVRRGVFIPSPTTVVSAPVAIDEPVVVEADAPAVLEEDSEAEIAQQDLPEAIVGSTIGLTVEGLEPSEQYQVILDVNNMAMLAEVLDVEADTIAATLPSFGLAEPTPATLHVVKADGTPVDSMAVMLIPAKPAQK